MICTGKLTGQFNLAHKLKKLKMFPNETEKVKKVKIKKQTVMGEIRDLRKTKTEENNDK